MTDLQILILSFVQGITEFLPISSSAHLVLTSRILNWPDQGLNLDIAVHFGTLGSVITYFFTDFSAGLRGGMHLLRGEKSKDADFALLIVIATIPVVIVGFLVKDFITTDFRVDNIIKVLAITSIIFGTLLWIIDYSIPTFMRVEHLNYKHGIFLGIMQAIALIPGVSRSGICITAGRLLGLERTESARIAMLMGMPTLFAAGILVGIEVYQVGNGFFNQQVFLAMMLAFCSGLFAIRVLMIWLQKSGMGIFAIYRIILGILLLIYMA